MKTIFNSKISVSNYKPIYKANGKWYVCFGYKEIMEQAKPVLKNGRYVKSNGLSSTGKCSYSYFVYDEKPLPIVIKDDIEEYINNYISNKIVNDFVWEGNNVHLTRENQMNYKASYDLAMQSGGQNLPIKIKTTKNGKTEYLVFFTIDELSNFYIAMNKYVNDMLEKGWNMKDSIDYSVYSV